MSNVAHRRHWSNIFRIEEDFQKRHVLRVLVCTFGYVLISTLLVCVFYVYMMNPDVDSDPTFWKALGEVASSWGNHTDLQRLVFAWVVSMSGLSALFAAFTGFYSSHRIAGPLYRLKSDLQRTEDAGRFVELKLRDGDELGDLVVSLNGAMRAVRDGAAQQRGETELRAELEKHLASFDAEGLCDADDERMVAWVDDLRRLASDA
jgi:hypothetical protein